MESIAFIAVIGAFLLALLPLSIFIVGQQTTAVVERFGRFVRMGTPGLHFKIPIFERIAGRPDLRIQQLDVHIETKTKDNVFVRVMVSVQYFIIPDKVYQAFYRLSDATNQIRAYIFDTVRAQVPTIKLDDVFEKKDDIAVAVRHELSEVMGDFGYGIVKALVTDIDPDPHVKAAMNEINAAERMRVAAEEKGEAEKILKVKAAEADAEAKAIVDGLRESVDEFQKSIPGASPQDVMNLVLMTQYFDTLKDVGGASETNTILIPHSPGALSDLSAQLRDAMIQAQAVQAPR